MADTWVLVADHARARLFSLEAGRLDEIACFANVEARVPGHERERAPPPRVHDRFGESRHATQARTLPQDKIAARFANELLTALACGRTAHEYRKLVLIAPPRFLGVINSALGESLHACVALRIAKNLTRRKPEAIRAELPRALLKPITVAAGLGVRPPG